MEYTVKIKADYNDGDCVSSEHTMDQETFVEFGRIAEIVKLVGGKHYNWDKWGNNPPKKMYAEHLTEEEIEWFDDYLPYVDNGVIHTIVNISYAPKVNWTRIL